MATGDASEKGKECSRPLALQQVRKLQLQLDAMDSGLFHLGEHYTLGCANSGARKFQFFFSFSVVYCSLCAFDFLHSVSQTGRGSNSPFAECMLRVCPASKKANAALPAQRKYNVQFLRLGENCCRTHDKLTEPFVAELREIRCSEYPLSLDMG
jgi:hypothetical protein